MKFGVHLPNFGPFGDPRRLAALARETESAGWDGFFIWDHILGDPDWREPMVDPWVALAAIAAATTKVRLGALVTAVPRRRPWKLAREIVTLDHLSNGRVVVGVGLGYPPEAEFEHFGEDGDAKRRARQLDEGLTILAGLWSGEPFSFSGTEYRLRETVFLPRPVQQPRPPVWVAAHSPNRAPLRRAARWDGVFPERVEGGPPAPDDLAEMLGYVRRHRQSNAPFDVVVAGRAAELGAEGLDRYAAAGATWWLEATAPDESRSTVEARVAAGPPRVSQAAPIDA